MEPLGATKPEQLRGMPKSNVLFHLALSLDALSTAKMSAHAGLAAPRVAEMLAIMRPEAIIVEGIEARNIFVRHQCGQVREDLGKRIEGMRRGRISRVLIQEVAHVDALRRICRLLMLGHPSHFGDLADRQPAVAGLQSLFGSTWLPKSPNGDGQCSPYGRAWQ